MSLSIILPLKDRFEFTPRVIDHLHRMPVRLIIADGSRDAPDQEWSAWFRGSGHYFYAGYDSTYERWFFKMTLALDRVTTPYAMICDNDDLPVWLGLQRCISFLDDNPAYIACSGRVRGFWLWPDPVNGPRYKTSQQYAMYDTPADYNQNTRNERVLAGFQNSWSFYAVYRTETLKTIWREVHDLNFSDLQVNEKFCAMRALSLGKIKCDPTFTSYLRQYNTSQGAAGQPDFIRKLLTGRFSADRDAVLSKMDSCGVDIEALRELWADWYYAFLGRNYGPKARLRRAAKVWFPRLAWLAQNRHRFSPLSARYR